MTFLSHSLEQQTSMTGLQLMSALILQRVVPSSIWHSTSYRLKFLFGTLCHPRATLSLLDYLAQHPQRDAILAAQPSLPCKLHSPYQAVNLSRKQALHNICDHYDFIWQRMPSTIKNGLLSKRPLELATIVGKEDQQYTITLNAISHQDKEGEARLIFNNQSGEPIAVVIFSFIYYNDCPTLFIGSLQGPAPNVDNKQTQIATKACHGLFPKRLVIEALLRVAELTQIKQIVAVSDNTHVDKGHRNKKHTDKVLADYDSFWQTMSSVQDSLGHHYLPLQIAHKPLEEMASKRRAEYRRRYGILNNISAQIHQTFSQDL